MKCVKPHYDEIVKRRAPQGARGLKSWAKDILTHPYESRPARGAWVEIMKVFGQRLKSVVAPRKGRVG